MSSRPILIEQGIGYLGTFALEIKEDQRVAKGKYSDFSYLG